MTDLDARARARLQALTANREAFLAVAQRRLAAFDAAIGELKTLLDPPAPSENGVADEALAPVGVTE